MCSIIPLLKKSQNALARAERRYQSFTNAPKAKQIGIHPIHKHLVSYRVPQLLLITPRICKQPSQALSLERLALDLWFKRNGRLIISDRNVLLGFDVDKRSDGLRAN